MDGMDMASMGGMDMGSQSLFVSTNQAIARGYWYGIAGITGLLTIIRLVSIAQTRHRLKRQERDPHCVPSRPRSFFSQAYATATATIRELSYAQPVYFTGRISKYFSPLPVGKWLVLAAYWTAILIFLWSNTILKPKDAMYAYKWEKVGFRAAWVTIAQIPFIYLLSMKFSPLTFLTGTSYERINWLHRWTARTVFLTAIVHWSFFLHEWWLADFVALEIKMMPMVRYGFGAFGTITWMILSGFGFFRAVSYEIFVAQHIAAAGVLLWLLFCHVPAYARWNVWLSVAFIAFDWSMRIVWNTLRNTHLLGGSKMRAPGYSARLEALPGDMVRLTISGTDFSWKAGQHLYLTIPRLRPLELHPFTLANASEASKEGGSDLTMLVKARSGFSKSLHKAALKSQDTGRTYRALLSGPWGVPPDLRSYETVVFIGCSSGASFVVPLLQELASKRTCVRRITLHWIIRHGEHLGWYEDTLTSIVESARACGVSVQITVHVTQVLGAGSSVVTDDMELKEAASHPVMEVESRSDQSSSSASMSSAEDEKTPLSRAHLPRTSSLTVANSSRPTVEAMIRPAVEGALGETAVVVCGGLSITAQARTFVAALSDERAVHKGTGAQGIFLFTETYGW
ncbi:ferric-chelate reductase Frp1 [Elasticomyces elasticus]|nr:ferric-chelate reductase Frp1 [Elasticomyces elasticus]KAK3666882.1 ferric-chelate reductase Frp1 [Elasticomyces elasticus]KAK4933417.1 ferric-chelate reductase Frp1 [Elasticomyces elasticus]KAK5755492.1 ferric-chelate reductase Frp1 [Elasticomyces elasticus]